MFIRSMKLLGVAILFLCPLSACEQKMTAKSNSQTPVQTITISVDRAARDVFFDHLRKFSDKHAFAIRIAPTTQDGQHFLIQMWREDIKIIGANSLEAQTFTVSIYENSIHPVPIPQLNFLTNDLKRFVIDVQGVTFLKVSE